MPQAAKSERERCGGEEGIGDDKAMAYLQRRGWISCPDGIWRWADSDVERHPTSAEYDAMWFLVDEWDYGLYELRQEIEE